MPRFPSLVRATLQLWGQQPLIWLLVLGAPNALAAALRLPAHYRWAAALAWVAAFGMGAGPLLGFMGNQWLHGRIGGRRRDELPGAMLRATSLTVLYAALALAPFAAALALRSVLPPAVIVLAVLLSTAPFHALLAPAFMQAAGEGPGGAAAVQQAWTLAGRRSWLHLGLIAAIGCGAAALLTFFGWAFAVTLRGQGDAVQRVMQAAGLSLGGSVWATLITVCGLDAISTAEGDEEPEESEEDSGRTDAFPGPPNGAIQRREGASRSAGPTP